MLFGAVGPIARANGYVFWIVEIPVASRAV